MIVIKKLYSEPVVFKPIEFKKGINLILGETTDISDKTNGVGKSMSIEFLNFCLLTTFSDSRVSKIPKKVFGEDVFSCLDLSIGIKKITIKRSVKHQNTPTITIDGVTTVFSTLDDANKELTNILFGSAISDEHPSFRSLMGPIVRDERSEFKSIIKCFDTDKNIPSDYTPHLYFLGINPNNYNIAKKLYKDLSKIRTARSKIKTDVENITNKTFKEAGSELNELNGQVDKIKKEVDGLENAESFDIVKDEIIELELRLKDLRTKTGSIKTEISRIKLFKGDNYIDEEEVGAMFEKFKTGLGDHIKKELHEVASFKKSIDDFQKTLLQGRERSLKSELEELKGKITDADSSYKEKLKILDRDGVLKSLKISISIYQQKLEEQSRLSSFIGKYNEYSEHIETTKLKRSTSITQLSALISDSEEIKKDFEETILDIHEYVMGNRRSSFNIKVSDKVQIVDYDLRIFDDGSHSNEREKVFLYDLALLLTKKIEQFHPALLVHDNIFDVDQDTLIKSLNFLESKENELKEKQYILTLNSDKLSPNDLERLSFDLDKYKRASFTKSNRFLGEHYQELEKK